MALRPIGNPPNPWHSSHVEWIDAPPDAHLEIYEEKAKTVLSENQSPDVGFRFSINPYRGCNHACSYCLSGDTPILMADGTTRRLDALRVGDRIYGTERRGDYRRYVQTTVLAHWQTVKPGYRIRLEDGTELVASGEHRFLTARGWKHVTGSQHGPLTRAHLTTNDKLMGVGRLASNAEHDADYRAGYLCGIVRGDGFLRTYRYARKGRANGDQHQFRLALIDLEPLLRAKRYLADLSIATHDLVFQEATATTRQMTAIRTHKRSDVEQIREVVEWHDEPSENWSKGFLAGIFDAEGSYSGGILRISNCDPEMIARTQTALQRFGFDTAIDGDPRGVGFAAGAVRVRGGMKEHLRFFLMVDPSITRKRTITGQALKSEAKLRVMEVEALGVDLPLFDITTGTGDFIANGVVSHNCYARPTHQYWDFGAGTDFDRKIVVKVNAPEVMEAQMMKPSWKGELVMFSGNTDCYQPLEASYGLTRRCLEVAAKFRNPVGIITKGAIIRRDIDVLQDLARNARVHVNFSVAFADDDMARQVEPGAPSPSVRLKAMRALADAGISVGVGVAPIIPGLNDSQIATILAKARDAGATRAFRVMLRLPLEVKPVFLGRLQEEFPDRAAKVENAVRDVRGGALYRSAFGERGNGQGARWDAIESLFDLTCRKLGLNSIREERAGMEGEDDAEDEGNRAPSTFRRPGDQLKLF